MLSSEKLSAIKEQLYNYYTLNVELYHVDIKEF